ncbi:MAG: BTAD domain-containing putative transcriptional regulator [Thermoleophilaceae bacterium]
MEFRILGPMEALEEGCEVTLGGGKQRALLAVLLLHANETLSTDRLIDELWGESPPATAAKAVQVHISRLRKALAEPRGNSGPDTIVTREHGYRLELDPERLDATRFERLLAEGRRDLAAGRVEPALSVLERALSLWRGPALADLAYEPFAQHEIARLDELRLAAMEQRIEARLALGGHAEVVGELEALIREHPYRERLHAQLMLALYRSERQADALQAYQEARRKLVEELGIEPGERLRDLERAILAQDPELQLAVVEESGETESAAEPSRSAFVGREAELAELVAGLDDVLARRGRLFLLPGEPGIGKSRLADELIAQARSRGASVLVGRCWEAGGAPAYWPWVQALRTYIRDAEPEGLRAQLGAGAPDLAQLLPELGELFPDLPEPPRFDSEGARFRLFDAASSFLRAGAQARPLVLVLDDMHAADEPSLLMLRFVARQIGDSRLLLVCAYRDVDPTLQDPLTAALAELVREPHTAQIALDGLSAPDVAEYAELSTGVEPAPQLVEAIHSETAGNPLFVAEVVRLLDAQARIGEADAHLGIPPGVRAVIGQRVGRLSEQSRRLLVPASVLGREFDLEAVARLADLPRDELLDGLNEAMAERVISDVPGSPGRLRFGHALIRDALYEDLSPAMRVRLHARAGETLETLYAGDVESHLAELAQHFLAAVPAAGSDKAIDYARQAGDRAAMQLAYEEAARLYEMALPLLGEYLQRCELLLALGDAQARAGDTAASKQSFREAADLAERLGLTEHLARAALGYGGRFVWEFPRGDVDHVPLLERALAAVGEEDSRLRVRLLARFAGGPLRDPSFPLERKWSLSEQALAMARRIGDPETLAYAISGYIVARHSPEFAPEEVDLATELIELAAAAGDLERAAEGYEYRIAALIELGDLAGAKADIAAMAKLAEKLRQPSQDWVAAVYSGLVALLEGKLAEAERSIANARSFGERGPAWNAALSHGMQLYMLRREQGRLDEVEDLVRRSAGEFPRYPIYRCACAQMAAEQGYTAEATKALEDLAAGDFAALPFDDDWLVAMTLLAETAAALRDVERADRLYRRLQSYGDRVAIAIAAISTGAVARSLGLLTATSESWDDSERHFEQALEINARIRARPWLAHTQRDYARMLSTRDRGGDSERAVELAGLALEGYRGVGMDSYAAGAARFERALRAARAG